MNVKRLLSVVLGLPVVILVLALGNQYFIDIFFSVVAIISMYEYFNAVKEKVNPVKWLRIFKCYFNIFYTFYTTL